jgi:hypothetical protein
MQIVNALPFALSHKSSAPGTASYSPSGMAYDFAIGGIPFCTAISDDRPYIRSMAPVRKEQFDNQQIPGEQSLANWWLRSQSSFIGGAGVLYQDPSTDNQFAIRYADSLGVNPWDNGRLTLLRKTTQRISDGTANKHFVLGWNDGTDRYWSAVGNVLKSDTGSATTTITWGGGNTIRSLTSDGTNYYAADNVGIYKGAGNGAGALAWNTGTTNVVIRWVKGRLMAGIDNKVYDLVTGGPALPGTPRMTHLNSAWTWTDFAEGTNAIYASGFAGSQSAIYKFVLSSTGDVPTLSTGGVLTAQLPLGETVLSMTTYLGTFVGIGTSRGFRVGQIDDNGDIVYGPLLFTVSGGVKAVAAYDRFFFVAATNAIAGSSGLYRVDLGQPIQDNGVSAGVRFAYATDLQALVTGEVCSVTNFGNSDRMVFAVVGQGSYLEHATDRESTGWLKTGRIRFNTLEPKIYKFLTVKTPTSQFGSVGLSVIDPGGAETSLITVSEGSAIEIRDVVMAAPVDAAEWVQLKMTLTRSAGTPAQGGEVNGWQLKAMPGATRQRLFQIPLQCFDEEKDRTGQRFGTEGSAKERLQAFEQIAQRGDAVSLQDLANDESFLVVVDDYQFVQKANPGPNRAVFGGYLTVQLRTIADVVTE